MCVRLLKLQQKNCGGQSSSMLIVSHQMDYNHHRIKMDHYHRIIVTGNGRVHPSTGIAACAPSMSLILLYLHITTPNYCTALTHSLTDSPIHASIYYLYNLYTISPQSRILQHALYRSSSLVHNYRLICGDEVLDIDECVLSAMDLQLLQRLNHQVT